jgi:uncharacterized protein (TIGR00106 family)
MSVIMELSIFPLGGGESVSPYVARAARIIEESGLNYTIESMGTSVEGEWDQVVDVLDKCFKELARDNHRLYLTVKADYRKERQDGLRRKVESVKEKLGQ